jgi:rhodanese-related sulfurtransferase
MMQKKTLLQELIGAWLLLTGCLIGGLVFNEIRTAPLSLVYASPEERLKRSVEQMGSISNAPIALEGDVGRDEMQNICVNRVALILDARPEIFYRLGHIPSALSLPRDNFEKRYQSLLSTLQSHRDKPLVVYCSDNGCHDSQMVADALQKLGYLHVRLFRGGWSEWDTAGLPEEKE